MPNALYEIEQDLGVGAPVVQDFDRAGIADHFGKLGQPGQVPPGERAEPEHRAIEEASNRT